MFNVMFATPTKDFKTSGLVRDGSGNPLEFTTEKEARDFLLASGYGEDAKIVPVESSKE